MDAESILEALAQSLTGDPWHGPALAVLLADVSPEQAVARPIAGAHTILELVLHHAAWTEEVSARLRGHSPGLPASGDWPGYEADAGRAWEAARRRLLAAHEELLRSARQLPAARWAERVGATRERELGTGVTVAVMLLGVAQHAAYHGGQIALLERATRAPAPG